MASVTTGQRRWRWRWSRAEVLAAYRDATDVPLVILALCTIPLLAAEFTADPSGDARRAIEVAYAAIWAAFVVDYLVELVLEEDRRRYLRQEWPAPVVIVLSVPIAGNPLQWLRALRVLRIFRTIRLGAVVVRGHHAAVNFPRSKNKQLVIAMFSFAAITVASAIAVYAVEVDRTGAEIAGFGDAVWWSVNTLTTIGGSSETPQTQAGRWLALLPILAGLGFVGVIAANLATRLFARFGEEMPELMRSDQEVALAEIMAKLDALHARIDGLEASTTRDSS
jgi:voltage-gated potassium channel